MARGKYDGASDAGAAENDTANTPLGRSSRFCFPCLASDVSKNMSAGAGCHGKKTIRVRTGGVRGLGIACSIYAMCHL
jgi:hypothetical protein